MANDVKYEEGHGLGVNKEKPHEFKEASMQKIDIAHDKMRDKATDLGHRTISGSSEKSASRYLTFKAKEDKEGNAGADYQVRFSNHGDRYPNQLAGVGERFSVDPDSGNTIHDAHNWLKERGIDLSKKVPAKPPERSLMYGEKASAINALRAKRGGTPLTKEEIEKHQIVNDIDCK